jgi:adenylosuccinate synthase
VDPVALLEEVRILEEQSVAVRSRLTVSARAHLVLPGHRALDLAREASRGASRLGTTGRGIGPAYEAPAARCPAAPATPPFREAGGASLTSNRHCRDT